MEMELIMGEAKLGKPEDHKEPEGQPQAQPYHAPRLQVYGAMTRLTAGGSGNANEGAEGPPASKRL